MVYNIAMEIIRVRHNPETARRAELRRDYLVPLYVMWSSDVPQPEAQAALNGVADAVNASGQRRGLVVLGSRQWSEGAFSSADWYLQEAIKRQREVRNLGHGQQVNVNNLTHQFYEEPWQATPHWEVSIVNTDLYADGTNFVFGVTQPDFAASVQSVKRLVDSVPAGELRTAMVRRLLRHEVGHMFGLPGRNYNVEQKLGTHCTNVCTMRQGMSLPEWAQLTQQEVRNNVHFCNDCMNDLRRVRDHYKPLPQPHV